MKDKRYCVVCGEGLGLGFKNTSAGTVCSSVCQDKVWNSGEFDTLWIILRDFRNKHTQWIKEKDIFIGDPKTIEEGLFKRIKIAMQAKSFNKNRFLGEKYQ